MRNWKIAFCRCRRHRGGRRPPSSSLRNDAAASAARLARRRPTRRCRPCRCRWPRSSRRRSRSISTIRRAPNRSAASRCRPRSPAISSSSSVCATAADVKEGDLLYTHRSARLPGGARSGQGAGCSATPRRSSYARGNLDRGDVARQERLPRQGHLRPAQQRRRPGRSGAGDGRGGGADRRAQPQLHGNPRALRRAPRPQPGAGRHPDQRAGGGR